MKQQNVVLVDGVPAAERRVDLLLLGRRVRDVQRGERASYGVPNSSFSFRFCAGNRFLPGR